MLLLLALLSRPAAAHEWNENLAKSFVQLSITCVEQEFPNYWERFEGKIQPHERHPAFFGCYDWHSAVHGHWAMLRAWKAFPSMAEAKKIEEILDRHFTPEKIAGEVAFLKTKEGFENPYGYGWFFRLLQELDGFDHPKAKQWRANLRPIAELFLERYPKSVDKLNRPSRVGTHDNTAFAMTHLLDYARATHDEKLAALVEAKAREFFGGDEACPFSYEPGPFDFLSPCLVEADLMRRVLPAREFAGWSARFLGKFRKKHPILEPVVPKDVKDPYLVHQIGLMFSKAAAMKAVAKALPASSAWKKSLVESAGVHAEKGISLMMDGGYGGTHWLATFAIFHETVRDGK